MISVIAQVTINNVSCPLDIKMKLKGIIAKSGRKLKNETADLPKTKFAQGIVRGKLMANEYPGILLCMAAALVNSGMRDQLLRKGNFRNKHNNHVIKDWQLLLETLVQWEHWLRSDKISKQHWKRLEQKHQSVQVPCHHAHGTRH